MTLTLTSDQLQIIKAHAERTYPEECCGLLLGRLEAAEKVVVEVRSTRNDWSPQIAEDLADEQRPLTKTQRYWIAPQEMLIGMREARRRGLEIIGIYHSHTDHPAMPSECDRRLAWSQYSYLIVSVQQGKVVDAQSWMLDDYHQFQAEEIQTRKFPRMRRKSLPTPAKSLIK
ncbi:MAG: M67 family metallopeptidase [Kovacikia sp.]